MIYDLPMNWNDPDVVNGHFSNLNELNTNIIFHKQRRKAIVGRFRNSYTNLFTFNLPMFSDHRRNTFFIDEDFYKETLKENQYEKIKKIAIELKDRDCCLVHHGKFYETLNKYTYIKVDKFLVKSVLNGEWYEYMEG